MFPKYNQVTFCLSNGKSFGCFLREGDPRWGFVEQVYDQLKETGIKRKSENGYLVWGDGFLSLMPSPFLPDDLIIIVAQRVFMEVKKLHEKSN